MSAPVDVLAVMDAACCVLAMDKTADPQKQLEQARAAVAELIDAITEIAEACSPDLAGVVNEAWVRSRASSAIAKVQP